MLTNVPYRRFKQSDFNKDSFNIDILSFLVQNFNPINLERKLDLEKERDMIKFLWDECIPHDFVRYMYQQVNYNIISKPNGTYQKVNEIVKQFIFEDPNRINTLKYKIEERFSLIHYVYLMLFSKIYNRTNNFGIQNKNSFGFDFQTWKNRKTGGAIEKILKKLSSTQANQISTEILSTAKDPKHYENREVQNYEQMPINIKMNENELARPTMVSVSCSTDENVTQKRAENRKILEKQLSENTIKMTRIKNSNKL